MVDDQSYETSVETAKREAEEQIKQIETLYLQKVEDLRGTQCPDGEACWQDEGVFSGHEG
jgi:hypothetical protein